MSIEQSNIAILSEAYRDWNDSKGGSIDRWMGLFDEEVVFFSLAQGNYGQDFTSTTAREEVEGYFKGLLSAWSMNHYTVDDFIASGDRVVMIGSTSWTSNDTGKIFDTRKVDVIRMKAGKISEFAEYYDTAAIQNACQ